MSVVYSAPSTDSLAEIRDALVAAINLEPGYLAVAGAGNSLAIVSTGGTLAGAQAVVTRSGSAGEVNNPAPDAAVVTLTGAPVQGATWSVTVDGFAASVLVTPTVDTVEEIAQALAAQINGNFGLTHEAVATGGQLMIVKKDGATPLAVGTLSITGGAIPGSGLVAVPGTVGVAPGSGEIIIVPVSVCHHVSTIGHRRLPIIS